MIIVIISSYEYSLLQNGEPIQEISEDIKSFLSCDIDQDRLKARLLCSRIPLAKTSNMGISKVSSVRCNE